MKIAVLTEPERRKKFSLEECVSLGGNTTRFLAYQDLCDKLGVRSNVEIYPHTLSEYLENNVEVDKIVLDNYVGYSSTLEEQAIAKLSVDELGKIVNLSGESLVSQELKTKPLNELDFTRYQKFAPKIFAGNKILTHYLIGDQHPALIDLLGFGFETPKEQSNLVIDREENVIVKPAQGSNGFKVRKVKPKDVSLNQIQNYVFGAQLVQEYIEQESIARFDRPTDIRVIVTKVNGKYHYNAMIRVGEKEETCSNLSRGGFGIGITPNIPIEDELEREITKLYCIDPDNPKLPRKILEYSQEFADKFNYDILGLDFTARRKEDGTLEFKLLEANSNPGEKIFYYTKKTESDKLDELVRRYDLGSKVKSDDEFLTSFDIAKARVLKLISVIKSSGVDTSNLEQELGIEDNMTVGNVYRDFSNPKDINITRSRLIKRKIGSRKHQKGIVDKYLKSNGITDEVLNNESYRRVVIKRLIRSDRLFSRVSNVQKSVEQGIIDSLPQLRETYNNIAGYSAAESVNASYLREIKEIIRQEAKKDYDKSSKISKFFNDAYESRDLEEKIGLYNQLLNIDPTNNVVRTNLGWVMYQSFDFQGAKRVLGSVSRSSPSFARAKRIYRKVVRDQKKQSHRLCLQAFETDNLVDKIKFYEQSLEVNPKNVRSQINLGFIYARSGRNLERAEELLKSNSKYERARDIYSKFFEK